jgi:hypothetical protein
MEPKPNPEVNIVDQYCKDHHAHQDAFLNGAQRMERIETQLLSVVGSQKVLMDRQYEYIQKITGMERDVQETNKKLDAMNDIVKSIFQDYGKRIVAVEDSVEELNKFKWFRIWMTDMRDKLFKNMLTIAFMGGAGIAVIMVFTYFILKYVLN